MVRHLLPIYMYHQIVPEDEMPLDAHLYVTPDILARQVLQLKKLGFSIITLGEAWQRISSGKPVKKCAVLTFDDLYDNFYRHAWPQLKQLGVRATAFAISQHVGKGDQRPMVSSGLFGISANELRELCDNGIEIGSHTRTHRELTTLPDPVLRDELNGSKHALSEIIGVPVTTCCYPRGRFSPRVMRYTEAAGYECAVSTLRGNMHAPEDRFRLKRIRAGMERIDWKLSYTTHCFYDLLNRKRTRRDTAMFAASDHLADAEA